MIVDGKFFRTRDEATLYRIQKDKLKLEERLKSLQQERNVAVAQVPLVGYEIGSNELIREIAKKIFKVQKEISKLDNKIKAKQSGRFLL